MLNSRNMLVRLFLLIAFITLLVEVPQAQGYRIRTDKKAMRNSLIRFGKRAQLPEDPLAHAGSTLYDQGADFEAPQMMLYPMFGQRQNLY